MKHHHDHVLKEEKMESLSLRNEPYKRIRRRRRRIIIYYY
jgi:hypothetical protein